mmetsp:Transcript_1956/g.3405  ORF Transcript_1956/g.3405 Transcript_1956/m.3405 type:complete len:240 (+) Transcript_1956:2248-2967(+)
MKIIEVKRLMYERVRHIFSGPKGVEADDEWINSNIIIQIKDSTLWDESSRYPRKKLECEFCGRRHRPNYDEICEIRTADYQSGNSWEEGVKEICLEDLYLQMNKRRDLIFEVMINHESQPNYKWLKENFVNASGKNAPSSGALTLDSCFRQFSKEEMLTGTDQWYCSKCKEHRDIHKKLELYRAPQILMVQIKRFQSKKSANSGRSGFFDLAYAQICQQEKVSEPVDFPLEGLDIKEHI